MTKSTRTARRSEDWSFDMASGLATHLPTGIVFRLWPHWHARLDDPHRAPQRWDQFDAGERTWVWFGRVQLPPDVKDRRAAHEIAPGDANAPEAVDWDVLADATLLEAALERLAATQGPAPARAMLERVAREAGERWIFRARLERNWTTGKQRAS
jgi:hypothetical protein